MLRAYKHLLKPITKHYTYTLPHTIVACFIFFAAQKLYMLQILQSLKFNSVSNLYLCKLIATQWKSSAFSVLRKGVKTWHRRHWGTGKIYRKTEWEIPHYVNKVFWTVFHLSEKKLKQQDQNQKEMEKTYLEPNISQYFYFGNSETRHFWYDSQDLWSTTLVISGSVRDPGKDSSCWLTIERRQLQPMLPGQEALDFHTPQQEGGSPSSWSLTPPNYPGTTDHSQESCN